jgi:perosamine synthetase
MKRHVIPHSRPTIGKEEIDAVSKVIASGQIAQGKEVEAFEREVAQKIGVKYAAAVSSGTAALHLSLLALGVSSGDEVIIPSYVCTALLNAVNYTGATPVIADIDPGTLNIDPEDVVRCISPSTKAIIVPHMFGLMADMERLNKFGIPLIEDCAQALGTRSGNSMAGSLGEVGIFSFYATKMMTCGEGGMVVSDSRDVIDRVRQGREYDNQDTYAIRFNYKMTDIQAAMGRVQLEKLENFIARRSEIAEMYNQAFNDLPLNLPCQTRGHIFFRYNVTVNQDVAGWISQMENAEIACAKPVYRPLHHYIDSKACPHADLAFQKTLSIPIYPTLSDSDIERVVAAVSKTYKKYVLKN